MALSVNDTLAPYWQTRLSLDIHQASLSGLALAESDRRTRAADSGFDVTTTYRHCTDDLLTFYHNGKDVTGFAALCPFDPASQGVFMAPADEGYEEETVFLVRPGNTLFPLSRLPMNSQARLRAQEDLQWILSPWIEKDAVNAPGLPAIGPISDRPQWVQTLCRDRLTWTLFDHPDVIARVRDRGYDSVETAATDGSRQLLVLDLADCLPTTAAFGPFAGLPRSESLSPPVETNTLYQSSIIKAIDKAADRLLHKTTGPVLNVWGVHFADGDEVAQWYSHGYLGDIATARPQQTVSTNLPMQVSKPELHLNGQPTRIAELQEALEERLAAGKPIDQAAMAQHFRDRAEGLSLDQPSFLSEAGIERTIKRLRFIASMVQSATRYEARKPQTLMSSAGLPAVTPTIHQLLNWDESLYEQPDGVQSVFRDRHTGRLGDYHGLTGGEAYEKLALKLGGHEAASKKLSRKGIVGLCYRETCRTHVDQWDRHYIIWDHRTVDPAHIAKQLEMTQAIADRRAERRASIAIKADHFADIVLGTAADVSSLCHEGAHLFLEMYTDAATQDDASDTVQEDYREMLDWLGVDDLTWRNMTFEQRKPYHERFAESFEAYLATRKSPIENTHKDYAGWMGQVYHDVRQELPNAKLSLATTNLFDKLIQSEAPMAHSAVSESVHNTVLSAAVAAGHPQEAAIIQATLYAAAYDRLFQAMDWPEETFLERYSLAITVATPDPSLSLSHVELSDVGPESLTFETGHHQPQR